MVLHVTFTFIFVFVFFLVTLVTFVITFVDNSIRLETEMIAAVLSYDRNVACIPLCTVTGGGR